MDRAAGRCNKNAACRRAAFAVHRLHGLLTKMCASLSVQYDSYFLRKVHQIEGLLNKSVTTAIDDVGGLTVQNVTAGLKNL